MNSFLDELADQLNLRWAWEKVRREATPGDNWFDQIELAGFELELERNLQSIAAEFRRGRYRLRSLKPLPFPKQPDSAGKPRLRQAFQVAVRDQVAWTAVVNVVGPIVDANMPAWSYGNRLFRSIWVQPDADGVKRRKIGHYRHASGHLYLPFGQSWPVFRRHVYLTTRAMASQAKLPELDERTKEEMDLQEQLAKEQRCPFLVHKYWHGSQPSGRQEWLYWCSIDLEKFYPTIRLSVVQRNIVEQLPTQWQTEASRLLDSMLRFRLNLTEWTNDDLEKMGIRPSARSFRHIPTGLYVAGFLANAGLLNVDRDVAKHLKDYSVAHFRFVDDHIVLAHSFDDLVQWIRKYMTILADSHTGVKVNWEKVEPKELAAFFVVDRGKRKSRPMEAARETAEKASRLDPQFPCPLMTKTLALVSAIARTDFNLLEPTELEALTDQLEHLLLVTLPEEEIPERTRLSFAATRLTRVAECRLASDEVFTGLNCRRHAIEVELKQHGLSKDSRQRLVHELDELKASLSREASRRKIEVNRAFQLIRRVLRERPDRVRLWTRALLMCRLTGVNGLPDLREEIERIRETNPLAAEYLHANMLALLGAQCLIAARMSRNEGLAGWRKDAARDFLDAVGKANYEAPKKTDRWFLRLSWGVFCVGVYCANLVLKDEKALRKGPFTARFANRLLKNGKASLLDGNMGHGPVNWAWWAARMTLRDLASGATDFVKVLGQALRPSRATNAFWRFFPLDVPISVLRAMTLEKYRLADSATLDGWWYDALRERADVIASFTKMGQRGAAGRVSRVLSHGRAGTASLYDWCDHLHRLSEGEGLDPRTSEWTALEIIRQIAALVGEEPTLGPRYLKAARQERDRFPWVHPANFRIPKTWLDKEPLTWRDWQVAMRNEGRTGRILYVSQKDRIVDSRYTPMHAASPLFRSVNPIRGLGILLYGLLKKSFDLPSGWNGPGHADVLIMLPRLLLEDMTCSSWTLGVLQGCLQPRVTENLFLKAAPQDAGHVDDDTLRDPVSFSSAQQVASAVVKCQAVLEEYQLSTLQHKARQLTPVSIRQLTEPEWNKVFGLPMEGGNAHE